MRFSDICKKYDFVWSRTLTRILVDASILQWGQIETRKLSPYEMCVNTAPFNVLGMTWTQKEFYSISKPCVVVQNTSFIRTKLNNNTLFTPCLPSTVEPPKVSKNSHNVTVLSFPFVIRQKQELCKVDPLSVCVLGGGHSPLFSPIVWTTHCLFKN